jgi:5'-nucleotidase
VKSTAYRILVTNDDGVRSPGLGVLARHLAAEGHDVFVAAPAVEASGSGAAIGGILPGDHISTASVDLHEAPGLQAFAVEGPPGRCVLAAALGGFGPPPELVISGINPGANVGRFLQLHSGTLGAALTAAGLGVNGMAVSIGGTSPTHWTTAATVATRLVGYLAGCERRTTLNLNVPDVPLVEVRGLRTAPVRSGGSSRLVLTGAAPGPLVFDLVDREPRLGPSGDAGESDSSLVEAGYAVITRVLPPIDVEPGPFPAHIV